MTRDERQARVLEWIRGTFGEHTASVPERVRRLVEEVAELAQAEGTPREQVAAIVEHVYANKPGEPKQEIGGIAIALLGYCAAKGMSADDAELAEVRRILTTDPDYFRTRQGLKADAGISVRGKPPVRAIQRCPADSEPVTVMPFTTRVRTVLKRMGVGTIGELRGLDWHMLRMQRDIGAVSLSRMHAAMRDVGIVLPERRD